MISSVFLQIISVRVEPREISSLYQHLILRTYVCCCILPKCCVAGESDFWLTQSLTVVCKIMLVS